MKLKKTQPGPNDLSPSEYVYFLLTSTGESDIDIVPLGLRTSGMLQPPFTQVGGPGPWIRRASEFMTG